MTMHTISDSASVSNESLQRFKANDIVYVSGEARYELQGFPRFATLNRALDLVFYSENMPKGFIGHKRFFRLA